MNMLKRRIEASSDGLRLAMLISEPVGEPKGIVQIVHGMCEHKERYIPFMEYLSAHGYVCAIHDHRGHGETVLNEEDLGYMYKGGWRALVEDIKLVQNEIKASYPALPYTLFGHSMGSMAVRSFTKRYDDSIDTLFVCGCPSYNPAGGAGRLLASLIGLFKESITVPPFSRICRSAPSTSFLRMRAIHPHGYAPTRTLWKPTTKTLTACSHSQSTVSRICWI